MTRRTGHHAVRVVIELGMQQPASGQVRFGYVWQRTAGLLQSVTLLAGFRVEQPFGIVDSELDPLGPSASNTRNTAAFGDLPVRRINLAHYVGSTCNVCAEFLLKKFSTYVAV